MNCPVCNGRTRVIDTDTYDRCVIRVRKCLECGYAETTDEVPREITPSRLPLTSPARLPAQKRLAPK